MTVSFFKAHEPALDKYIIKIENSFEGQPQLQRRRDIVVSAIRRAVSDSDEIEQQALSTLNAFREHVPYLLAKDDLTESLCDMSRFFLRIARERLIRTERVYDTDSALFNFFSHRNGDLQPEDYREIDIAMSLMPVWHVRYLLEAYGKKLLGADDSVSERIQQHKTLIANWENEIRRVEKAFDAKREYIDKLKTDFNFVGLSKAFQDMEGRTQGAKRGHFFSLIALSVVIFSAVAVPAILLLVNQYGGAKNVPITLERYALIVPAILSVEVILIYFFRIVLRNYQSLRGLILQLQQRQALCAFIQQYIEFKKENSDTAVDKFEALIFSGLVGDPEKLPSTFDGLEQITKIAAMVRGNPG